MHTYFFEFIFNRIVLNLIVLRNIEWKVVQFLVFIVTFSMFLQGSVYCLALQVVFCWSVSLIFIMRPQLHSNSE